MDPETELSSLVGSNNKQNQSGVVADQDPRRFGKPNRIRMKTNQMHQTEKKHPNPHQSEKRDPDF